MTQVRRRLVLAGAAGATLGAAAFAVLAVVGGGAGGAGGGSAGGRGGAAGLHDGSAAGVVAAPEVSTSSSPTQPPRAAVDPPPGLREPSPPLVSDEADAAVPTDPEEAAVAYLRAVEEVGADDAGTRRRLPHLAPENPEATSGVLVTDAPPPGTTRTIEVRAVEEWARRDDRAAYRITYRRWLHDGPRRRPEGAERTTFVAVARQPDGTWRVTRHGADLDPAD